MPTKNDELLWMTSNPYRAALVGANVMSQSKHWNLEKPPCVVFDVDETMLLNHPSGDDTFKTQKVGKSLFQHAAKENIPVFIVTARAKSQWAKKYLVEQLKATGYDLSNVRGIYMQSRAFIDNEDGGADFKRHARDKIGESYTIVVNAGDRWTDVLRNHSTSSSISGSVPYTTGVYVGVKPADPYTLYSIKFPDEK
jgi:predicted secreted acid phosphatase